MVVTPYPMLWSASVVTFYLIILFIICHNDSSLNIYLSRIINLVTGFSIPSQKWSSRPSHRSGSSRVLVGPVSEAIFNSGHDIRVCISYEATEWQRLDYSVYPHTVRTCTSLPPPPLFIFFLTVKNEYSLLALVYNIEIHFRAKHSHAENK